VYAAVVLAVVTVLGFAGAAVWRKRFIDRM